MKVTIQTEKSSHHQGEQVNGKVLITTGDAGLTGDSIILKLTEYWWHSNVQAAGTGWKGTTLDEVVLHQTFDFPPGTEHRFPFQLQLTKNCRITRLAKDNKGDERCGFEVELVVKDRKNRKHELPLEVLPGREFLAIIETCLKKFQMKEREYSEVVRWTGDNDHRIQLSFTASNPHIVGFRVIQLQLLQMDDGGVVGKLDFGIDPSLAKGLWQRFWALFSIGSGDTRPFQLTASQLFLPDGTANHSAIAKAINNVIDEVVTSRR